MTVSEPSSLFPLEEETNKQILGERYMKKNLLRRKYLLLVKRVEEENVIMI